MKYILNIAFLLIPNLVFAASLSSSVYLNSNYIYRGVSFSNQGQENVASGSPVLQTSLDYYADNGVGVSLFTGNVDSLNLNTWAYEKDQELDAFLSYSKNLSENLSIGAGLNYFSFFKNSNTNMIEYAANITYQGFRIDSGYAPNYSGTTISLLYSKLSKRIALLKNLYIDTHIGYAKFGSPESAGISNYYDYKAGFSITTAYNVNLGVAYTNTLDRKNLITNEVSDKDGAVTISLSSTFDLMN